MASELKVPKEWRVLQVDEVAEYNRGVSYAGRDLGEQGLPFLNLKSFQKDGGYRRDGLKHFSGEHSDRHAVKTGDVIVANTDLTPSGDVIGAPALVPKGLDDPIVCSHHVNVVRLDETTIARPFFYYALCHPRIRHRMRGLSSGTTVLGLGQDDFGLARVPVPPLPEQKKIATILASVDEAIEATEAVIEQTRRVKKGLLQELLTRGIGHTEFTTPRDWFIGRIPGVDQIPASWEIVEITEVARLESGHTPSRKNPEYWDGDIQWLSLHDTQRMEKSVLMETSLSITAAGISNSSARILPAGTVALSRTATVGKCVIFGRDMATSQDFACYVCGPRLHNRFLLHLFRSMGQVWSALSGGSTHQTVYMPDFRKLQIPLPSIEEQRDIAAIIDSLVKPVLRAREQVNQLREIKKGLLQDLLTGKVRVNVDETAGEVREAAEALAE